MEFGIYPHLSETPVVFRKPSNFFSIFYLKLKSLHCVKLWVLSLFLRLRQPTQCLHSRQRCCNRLHRGCSILKKDCNSPHSTCNMPHRGCKTRHVFNNISHRGYNILHKGFNSLHSACASCAEALKSCIAGTTAHIEDEMAHKAHVIPVQMLRLLQNRNLSHVQLIATWDMRDTWDSQHFLMLSGQSVSDKL